MNIKVGSSVVHDTLTFLSVGTVVNIHDDKGQTIFEVAWPFHNGNGFHSDKNLRLSTDKDKEIVPDKSRACWY